MTALSCKHAFLVFCCGVARRWSNHVVDTLTSGGVTCRAVSPRDVHVAAVQKLLWSCIFWMMSAALGGKQVSGG